MTLTEVGLEEIHPIAIGAGILGTGGGGNPYLGSLHLRELVKELGPQRILAPFDLPDEARVAVVGGIGAPTVSIEKLDEGTEMARAIRLLEKHLRHKFDAIAITEIGGANSMRPMIAGLQVGLPTVDCDGMGRAFPEVQMSAFLFDGAIKATPLAMTDARGTAVVIPHAVDDVWAERLARNLVVSMGARAGLANLSMTGAQTKRYGIHYTLSLAHVLGCHVLEARKAGSDVPEAIAGMLDGKLILRGKIVDVERRTVKGFARGHVVIQSFDGRATARIQFQNEFLIATVDGEVAVTVPDLVCIVTEEGGEPVSTELLRYGTRVAVLGVPAPDALKTEAALAVVGPKAFGFDLPYRALPGGVVGRKPNGRRPNGRKPNGRKPNGRKPDGAAPNGKAPDGAPLSGKGAGTVELKF